MLDEIKSALETLFPDLPIYYGSNAEATGKKIYNYIVFWRDRIDWKAGSKGDPNVYYTIALVRQDYIPEEDETKIYDTLKDLPGLREVPGTNPTFRILVMPGTSLQLETAEYSFVAARKRVK